MGGQGRGRTADLPLFRRTLVPTELPDLGDVALGATSAVLTGFEPATSTLTGWRALHAALQDHLLPPTLADDAPRGGSARGNPLRPKEHITGTLVVASSFRPSSPGEAAPTMKASDSAKEMGCDVRSPGTL